MADPVLHLASSSPRRREILESLGLTFTHGGVGVDEARNEGENVESMAVRLARDKAAAVDPASCAGLPVLAADTIVVLGDEVFGKPRSKDDAVAMLAALSGRVHRVLTGVALSSGGEVSTGLSDTEVSFRDIGRDEAAAYWHSGEPADKAGAYAVQGLGGIFVRRIKGSYSGVVGLPVFETARLLERVGIGILNLRTGHD